MARQCSFICADGHRCKNSVLSGQRDRCHILTHQRPRYKQGTLPMLESFVEASVESVKHHISTMRHSIQQARRNH